MTRADAIRNFEALLTRRDLSGDQRSLYDGVLTRLRAQEQASRIRQANPPMIVLYPSVWRSDRAKLAAVFGQLRAVYPHVLMIPRDESAVNA